MTSEKSYLKAYKFAIFPNEIQEKFIQAHFDSSRFLYNKIIAETLPVYSEWDDARKKFYANKDNRGKKFEEIPKPVITRNSISSVNAPFTTVAEYRKTVQNKDGEYFLKDVDSTALVYVTAHVERAYKMYENPMIDSGLPNFKKKGIKQSYTTKRDVPHGGDRYDFSVGTVRIDFENSRVLLPKFSSVWKKYGEVPGWIKIKMHRDMRIEDNPAYITETTVTRDTDGKYFISFLVHYEKNPFEKREKNDKKIGVTFAVANEIAIATDGEKTVRYYKENEEKIKRLKKHIEALEERRSTMQGARWKDGVYYPASNNYKKISRHINKLHAKIKRIRQYNTHAISNGIINSAGEIFVREFGSKQFIEEKKAENPEMTKDDIAYLNKQIADANIGNLIAQIEYKSDAYDRRYIKIDKMFPCSRTCSECGNELTDLSQLEKSEWTCPSCGTKHNKFVNSAKNILIEGEKIQSVEQYKQDIQEKKKSMLRNKKGMASRINNLIYEHNQNSPDDLIRISKSKVNSMSIELSKKKEVSDDEIIGLAKTMTSSKKRSRIKAASKQ